ncbi:MAG: aminotransferase class V-fold PLP-dependent enzyme [Rhodobacterales bacterium]|nr:aminotransferase class V-fold PLP-dependent enzyme [Rhodobacterales bacterium]
MPLSKFRDQITTPDQLATLRAGLIGEGVMIPGAEGDVPLVYADYVASGRALRQVEDFITHEVLPYYANSHTEASYCGGYMTRLREDARGEIAQLTNAGDDCAVIFAGSGATAGLNRLVTLLGVNMAKRAVVFVGPYEHHSNILPWRESRAEVVEIPEAAHGGPDLEALERALADHKDADLKIGSFSAASNVTGIETDADPVTRVLKQHGALSVWDYAGAGPYLAIDMEGGEGAQKDAVVISAHKFAGGPAASGVLILRKSVVKSDVPSWPGGGTVSFVSPWRHDYSHDLATREEAGTPNIIGDVRAALVFIVKDVVGVERIAEREAHYIKMARAGWRDNPQIEILGNPEAHRLAIFSFLVHDASGGPVSEQLFTRLLSSVYGIQVRGGCACAGPYGHRLLHIDHTLSDHLRDEILAGNGMHKPGWVRLNFSYLMSEETVRYIIESVNALSRDIAKYGDQHDAQEMAQQAVASVV